MGQVTVDFSAVPEYEPLPSGTYQVVIDHVELRTGKDSGQPYLNFDLVVSEEGEFEGRHLFTTGSLAEKSLWHTKAVMKSLGVLPEDEIMNLEVDDESGFVLEPEMSGLPAIAEVVLGTYQGRKQNNVTDLRGPDEEPEPEVRAPTPKVPAAKTATRPTTPVTPAKPAVKPGQKLNLR
jgi:hypothetical protein